MRRGWGPLNCLAFCSRYSTQCSRQEGEASHTRPCPCLLQNPRVLSSVSLARTWGAEAEGDGCGQPLPAAQGWAGGRGSDGPRPHRRSGGYWTGHKRSCTGTRCWRSTARGCPWVRLGRHPAPLHCWSPALPCARSPLPSFPAETRVTRHPAPHLCQPPSPSWHLTIRHPSRVTVPPVGPAW